ncbi:UDP-N-acetylmuramate--L-alanine ligase [Croceiramulus getboli]|nr:UDP-N-acetylmuramate--L-alanine ligase [Flavobacteriaceae bacterium YJPT1-3]
MKGFEHIQNVYFIGIGGIGMSALAHYFYTNGKRVSGYDRTPGVMTTQLQTLGLTVRFKDDFDSIPEEFKDKERTLVVYTPAIPVQHGELVRFRESGFTLKKRAEVLGMITRGVPCLAVAGTHGKTTTSCLLGHLLAETGAPVTAFLGGVAANYQSNLINKGNEVVVVEADEFDRSFLHLDPTIACITSMDADHLDIYGSAEALTQTFEAFSKRVPETGHLLIKKGLPLQGHTVAVGEAADFSAQNIRIEEGHYVFDLHYPQGKLENLVISLPGRHNLFNAAIALGMAIVYGSPPDRLPEALSSFKGIHRRFNLVIQTEDRVVIDDYAHHPTEIDAVHDAVREWYPEDRLLAVFQPHLYSRTRDFMEGFAQSLSRFDEVWLMDIYPAREEPIPGIHSEALLQELTVTNKTMITKETLRERLEDNACRVQVIMGAGDIGACVEELKAMQL